jgi:high-affinity Fe2+/Pb2+ permease
MVARAGERTWDLLFFSFTKEGNLIIFLKGCPGWGANLGSFVIFVYFTITLPLNHSGSPLL